MLVIRVLLVVLGLVAVAFILWGSNQRKITIEGILRGNPKLREASWNV
jgi:hypothetical protein